MGELGDDAERSASQPVAAEVQVDQVGELADLLGQFRQPVLAQIQMGQVGEPADTPWQRGQLVLAEVEMGEP